MGRWKASSTEKEVETAKETQEPVRQGKNESDKKEKKRVETKEEKPEKKKMKERFSKQEKKTLKKKSIKKSKDKVITPFRK